MENTMTTEAMEVVTIVKKPRAKAVAKVVPSEVAKVKRVKKEAPPRLIIPVPEPVAPIVAEPEPVTPPPKIRKENETPPKFKRMRKPKESVVIDLEPVPPFPIIDLTESEAAPVEVVKKTEGRPFIYNTREEYLAAKAKNFRNAYAKDPEKIKIKNALYKAENADHFRLKQKERYYRLKEVKQFNKIVEQSTELKEDQKVKLIQELSNQ